MNKKIRALRHNERVEEIMKQKTLSFEVMQKYTEVNEETLNQP